MNNWEKNFQELITRFNENENLKIDLIFEFIKISKFSFKIVNGLIIIEIGPIQNISNFKYNFNKKFEYKSIGSI